MVLYLLWFSLKSSQHEEMSFAGSKHRDYENLAKLWPGEAEPEAGLEENMDSREGGHLKI